MSKEVKVALIMVYLGSMMGLFCFFGGWQSGGLFLLWLWTVPVIEKWLSEGTKMVTKITIILDEQIPEQESRLLRYVLYNSFREYRISRVDYIDSESRRQVELSSRLQAAIQKDKYTVNNTPSIEGSDT